MSRAPISPDQAADFAAGTARRPRRVGLVVAGLVFLAIFLLRLLISSPEQPIALLYAIPVLIVAIELGTLGGVGAAVFAVVLAAIWDLGISDAPHDFGEYAIRGALALVLGFSFGLLATQLRASIEAQARFWELSSDLLATADATGHFRRVSPSWTRELGWSAEELTSRPFFDFVHPDDREYTRDVLTQVIETGEGSDIVNRYRCRDGDYRTVQWSAKAEPDTGLVYAAARDISERVEIEQQLQDAVKRANTASEAKSEFLSRMSHELRTPLNAILGFTQLLEFSELEARDREAVKHIGEGGKHLLRLVNELLEISVIETGRITVTLEPVVADDILEEILALIEPLAAEARIDLRREPSAPGICVRADRQRLTQVLINLITNAVKYNRPGGTVSVACEVASPGQARFVIADDGPGMDEAQIRAVFTPFERLGAERSQIEGTGLGLPLAKRLTELMGGTLDPESRPGLGTTMRVGLAVADGPSVPAPYVPGGTRAPGGPTPDRPRTVVYVEDDDASTELVERAFERAGGTRFLSTPSGGHGLRLVREEPPDVVLLDLDLPDVGGAEILRRLKEDPRTAPIPVIVISADTREEQAERLLAAGASAYLTKPVEINRLMELALVDPAGAERSA